MVDKSPMVNLGWYKGKWYGDGVTFICQTIEGADVYYVTHAAERCPEPSPESGWQDGDIIMKTDYYDEEKDECEWMVLRKRDWL